jgi:diguanylate cyclase (GGDEF)-like protein
MVRTLQEISARVTPVIGRRGVAALYARSLCLSAAAHPWLARAHDSSLAELDLAALRSVLAHQSRAEAAVAASCLVQTFGSLLTGLIGYSLTTRLLGSEPPEAPAVKRVPEPGDPARASGARGLTRGPSRIGPARAAPAAPAAPARFQHDLSQHRNLADSRENSLLLEANAELVQAALRARSDAESATQALNEASRAVGIDVVTELPTRVLLLDRFAHAIAEAKRHRSRLAMLFLDLDDFKQINDRLGHAVGDQALRHVAQCLVSAVRESDTVSRHGGDEFVILVAEMTLASDAMRVANQVIAALDTPWRVGTHVLRLRASIGISIYPDDGDNAATLLERADAAMYRAKRRGRAGFVFYGASAWGKTSPANSESASTGYLADGAAAPAPSMDSGPVRRSPAVLTVLTPSTPSTPPTPSAATVKDPGPPAQ